jgi:hypothetical protein
MTNTQKAQEILQSLVQGLDPDTGEALPRDNVLNRTDVLRALLAGVSALQVLDIREQRRSLLPANVGKPWTQEEEHALITSFANKEPVADIAERHGRTHRSIEARLERLGLMTAADRSTRGGFGSDHIAKAGGKKDGNKSG